MGEGKDNVATLMGTKRLADAVRQAKIAAAQRSDVVVDIREADRARLEILQEELQPLIDELPAGEDMFDGTANVVIARDRRTYRLVRETRLGRVTLVESTEARIIADRVTDYVAERIVERDKAFAVNDELNERIAKPAHPVRRTNEAPLRQPEPQRSRSTDFVIAAVWLMIGVVVGAGLLLAISSYLGVSVG